MCWWVWILLLLSVPSSLTNLSCVIAVLQCTFVEAVPCAEAWSSDPNVDSIVIMSGTPILFMSTEAARVAMSFEVNFDSVCSRSLPCDGKALICVGSSPQNERYSMYPDEQNTTRELMDLIWCAPNN